MAAQTATEIEAPPPKKKVIEMIEGYRYLTHTEYHDAEYMIVVLRRMTDNEEAIE